MMQDLLNKYVTLTLILAICLCGATALGQTVSVGSGSYTTVFPGTDVAGRNTFPSGAPGLSGVAATKPVPTNDWWSDLMKTDHGGKAFNYPLSFKSRTDGLVINYTIPLVSTGTDYREPISAANGVIVGTSGLSAASSTTSDHSDWSVTMDWSNTFFATMNIGSPFVYFEKNGGAAASVQVPFNSAGASVDGHRLIIQNNMNGANYVVFGPTGSTWTGSGGSFTNTLNGQDYWSMVMLPPGMNISTGIAEFEQYAYVFPENTEVSWSYNESNGVVRSTFTVTPDVKEGVANTVYQGLLPHQWDRLAGGSPQPGSTTYPSVRGEIRMLASNSFIVENTFSGILPTLPDLGALSTGYDPSSLASKIDAVKNEGLFEWTDSYNEGQGMNKLIQVARIADQQGDFEARDQLLNTVQTRLEDWLTAEGGEVAFLFYYNDTWDALLGYPAGHRQDENLNDHHFHWGYFIHAAAAIEQFRPGWADQWGGMIDLLIRDAANPSRTDNMFPFLRNFSPFGGHSWANGFATEPNGNDQESTSESMQFNSALIHWGTITNNDAIRDLGIYLYTTELSTIQEYWFDVEERSFQPEYNYEMVARVWSGGYDNGTWWTNDVAASYGIQLYPIHGGSIYLGHREDYVQRVWTEMTQETEVLSNQPNVDLWYDTYWKFYSFIDPQGALDLYNSYTDRDIKVGISDAQTYHWLHAMNAMGQVREEITANYPIAAAFGQPGNMTYVAHNYGSTPINIQFSDGFTLSVPANSMATNKDSNASITLTANASEVSSGAAINLSTSVTGTDVSRVDFYQDGTLIGSDASAPYSLTTGALSAGFPQFHANAVGDGVATSNIVAVQVGAQLPYLGAAVTIPGTIEAGNYDSFEGGLGQGISYFDNDASNQGDFRPTEGVDASSTTGEGNTIGWVDPGEWLEYTINAAQTGAYDVTIRYASGNADGGGPFWFERDDIRISGDVTVPFTGTDWDVWQDVVVQDVNLVQGEQVLRLVIGTGGLNIGRMSFAFDGDPDPPVLTSIQLTPSTTSANVDAAIQFSAQGLDQFGNPIAVTFNWNTTCGTIDQNGLYTAPSSTGQCDVNVSSGIISASRTLTINDGSTGIGDILWEEEFNVLNTELWTPNVGDGCPNLCGWGNNELQYYAENNVSIEGIPGDPGNNALVLEARNESAGTRAFTSGKVDTDGKVSVHYGLVEVRMQVPDLQTGLWPAAWLLGDVNLPWPAKGEIDMMEMGHKAAERARLGHAGSNVNNYVGANAIWQAEDGSYASIAWDENYNQPYVASEALANRFVTYRMYWEPTQMRFTVIDNDVEYDLYAAPLPIDANGDTEAFTKPFYMLLNLAVGGDFTDAANNAQMTAPLPAKMLVDYVKVYEYNGHGSVSFDQGLIAENGTFGVYTENTPVDNQLSFGSDADIYGWGETVQEGTEAPLEGSEVIAWETVNANSWFGGGIASLYGRNMSNFEENGTLNFSIKIPADITFRVGITDNFTNEAYVNFPAGQTTYGLVRDGDWGQVSIPLADLSGLVAFQDINYMFAIVSQDGALPASTFQFAIDDIYWEDGNGNSPVLTSIVVNPTTAQIDEGQTQQFNAQGFDQNGDPISAVFSWSASDGSIDINGLYEGTATGNHTITASSGTVTGTANIAVNAISSGWTIPGLIEAENFNIGGEGVGYHDLTAGNTGGAFRTGEDVDIEVTGDPQGGEFNVGWIDPGEWLAFDIDATASSELYRFDFRVASPDGNGSFHLEVDGNSVTDAITIPQATNGWQNYTTVSVENVNIHSGSHELRVVFDAAGLNLNNFEVIEMSGPVLTSIVVTPANVSIDQGDTQQYAAQGFDQNGDPMNVSFSWTATAGDINNSGLYTGTETGAHTISATSGGITGQASIQVSEVPVLTSIIVSPAIVTIDLGQSQQFTAQGLDQNGNPMATTFTWTAAQGSIDGSGLFTGDITGSHTVTASSNSIEGTSSITVNEVAQGWSLPGRIEAENFNGGGEGIGYHDLTAGNTGGAFRPDEDVDIEVTGDPLGGSYNVGWIASGEWLAFDINATAASGIYDFDFRVASPGGSGAFHLEIDGQNATDVITIPQATGGWQNYITVTVSGVSIASGNHEMRVVFDASGLNLNYIEGFAASIPVLTTIVVSPSNAIIDQGQTQQFSAQGFDQEGHPMAATFEWSVDGGSIDGNGLFTGSSSGDHTVTVTSNGIEGSAGISVNEVQSSCTGGPTNGDYSYTVSGGNSPALTFEPGYPGVGSGIVILYYGTSPNGNYPGYIVNPGQAHSLTNVTVGQTVYFYYTYSVPEGGERNTSANRHDIVVGGCGTGARFVEDPEVMSSLKAITPEISLYPNPAQEVINISSHDQILDIQVYDLNGTEVMRWRDDMGKNAIRLRIGDLRQGVYMLRLSTNTENQIKRLIKR